MCWFCMQYLLSWGGWCLCVKRCMKEPDMMTCWTLLGKGPNWVVRVSSNAVCTFAVVETEWLVVWCYTSTSNTYPSNFPWHLEEWVLLWDFWIPIFNVCAGMGDFTSIWFHVFYARIVQSCKYKTSMVRVVLLVLLQSWCFFLWSFKRFSPALFLLLCVTDVLLCTAFLWQKCVLVKSRQTRVRMGHGPVVLNALFE